MAATGEGAGMSYTISRTRTIRGTASGSFSYPASESGGSHEVTVSFARDVEIDIYVDTDPFDGSVHSLRGHVDGLTAAVIATESAHVEEKADSARRVAASLNRGFNGLIRSEISQQMAGLKSRVDSLLLKLRDLGVACRRAQQNMQMDYARITERYAKVFEELDREVERRVTTLDGEAMAVRRHGGEQAGRMFRNRLCGIATVTSAESARAQMRVAGAGLRAQAQQLLQRALSYLAQERGMQRRMASILSGESKPALFSLPVLYMEADSQEGSFRKAWMHSGKSSVLGEIERDAENLFRQRNLSWQPMSAENHKQTESYLLARLESIRSSSPDRDARIRQQILRLWRQTPPQTLSA